MALASAGPAWAPSRACSSAGTHYRAFTAPGTANGWRHQLAAVVDGRRQRRHVAAAAGGGEPKGNLGDELLDFMCKLPVDNLKLVLGAEHPPKTCCRATGNRPKQLPLHPLPVLSGAALQTRARSCASGTGRRGRCYRVMGGRGPQTRSSQRRRRRRLSASTLLCWMPTAAPWQSRWAPPVLGSVSTLCIGSSARRESTILQSEPPAAPCGML